MNRNLLFAGGLLNLSLTLFKIGVDGAWWRFFLFLAVAVLYLVPLVETAPAMLEMRKTQIAP